MGALSFAAGSQRFDALRGLRSGDESERLIQEAMDREQYPYVQEPFALGDVSFHSGLTFHRAPPNETNQPRKVMTVIYIDRDITITEPVNEFQRNDLEKWMPGARVGERRPGPLNPILYEVSRSSQGAAQELREPFRTSKRPQSGQASQDSPEKIQPTTFGSVVVPKVQIRLCRAKCGRSSAAELGSLLQGPVTWFGTGANGHALVCHGS
jgi:hypothetical protein